MPEMQALFHAALSGGAPPAGLVAQPDLDRRFAVYRNNVAYSLSRALAARFPVIERLLGAEYLAALAPLYRAADPPRGPVLAEWGAGFAAFLDGFAPLAGWPWLGDVARIEWARGLAFHAPDAAPLDPATLAGADPQALRLRLHPSVTVLPLAHPAVAIWAQNQPGAAPAPLPTGPQIALILRDRAGEVPVEAIPPDEARLIAALAAGETLAQAAAHVPDPAPRLVALMAQGAFVTGAP